MLNLTSKSRDCWFPALVCALAAGGALSPAAVVASCGDYVMLGASHRPHGGFHHHPASSKGRTIAGKGTSLEVEVLEENGSSPARAPCSGPECSGHRGSLPAAPVGAQVTTHEWCINHVLVVASAPHDSVAFRGVAAARPIRRASHIFHPPRFTWGWLAA